MQARSDARDGSMRYPLNLPTPSPGEWDTNRALPVEHGMRWTVPGRGQSRGCHACGAHSSPSHEDVSAQTWASLSGSSISMWVHERRTSDISPEM
jgi:hypothetical protein